MNRLTILGFSAFVAFASMVGCASPVDGSEDESEQSGPAQVVDAVPAKAADNPLYQGAGEGNNPIHPCKGPVVSEEEPPP